MARTRCSDSGTAGEVFFEDKGSGAPVVLVRSASLARTTWQRLARAFQEEGHRVVSYDRRTRSSVGINAKRFADDLSSLLTSLKVQQAAIVGHGAGGRDVVDYLTRFGPARVIRVLLIAPPPALLERSIEVPTLIVAHTAGGLPAATIGAMLRFVDD